MGNLHGLAHLIGNEAERLASKDMRARFKRLAAVFAMFSDFARHHHEIKMLVEHVGGIMVEDSLELGRKLLRAHADAVQNVVPAFAEIANANQLNILHRHQFRRKQIGIPAL